MCSPQCGPQEFISKGCLFSPDSPSYFPSSLIEKGGLTLNGEFTYHSMSMYGNSLTWPSALVLSCAGESLRRRCYGVSVLNLALILGGAYLFFSPLLPPLPSQAPPMSWCLLASRTLRCSAHSLSPIPLTILSLIR